MVRKTRGGRMTAAKRRARKTSGGSTRVKKRSRGAKIMAT